MIKKSQTILDYVILSIVVIAGLMALVPFLRNTLSGKMREGADVFGQGEVYNSASTVVTTQ